MRRPADHMLISRRSFLFTLEQINILMKERSASNVHLLCSQQKNIRKITKL